MAGDELFAQAQAEYPVLQRLALGYKYNPGGGPGFLEFWPGDEAGTPEYPRPKEFSLGTPGVEVFNPKTRPIDIMGDIASHYLKDTDPIVKQHYQQFEQSLQPWQRERIQEQYAHAQSNEGEQRPFAQWYEHSGLPAYFRGYAFQQWERPEEMYTPEQMRRFDQMNQYLRQPIKPSELRQGFKFSGR